MKHASASPQVRYTGSPGWKPSLAMQPASRRIAIGTWDMSGRVAAQRAMAASWRTLVNSYLENADALQVMFLLVDVRRTPADQDIEMHEWTRDAGVDERILLTKSDKLSNNQLTKQKTEIAKGLGVDPAAMIPCSVVTKKGIEDVRREIASRI